MRSRFADRRDAGRALATELRGRIADNDLLVVLGLPRGGVVVAAEVAAVLKAELDALVVRKLGVPGHEELAVGAVAAGADPVVNEDVRRRAAISAHVIAQLAKEQLAECARREAVYRPGRAPIDVTGREVVLVDDGLATGATMRAAVRVLPALGPPRRVIVAVPVGPRDTVDELATEADEVVCLATPRPFLAVGYAYDDFRQTTDDEVRELLVYPSGH
ncbi:MAG: phosphoribosyltransferase family protein [Candidatus Nanopelagicales bacterium]